MKKEKLVKNDNDIPGSTTVLIVGAGPTGLTAALELSRFGIDIILIDKANGPSTTSKALAVQSRTLELFEQRGLSEKMLNKGNRATATTIYNEKRELGKVDLTLIQSRYNFCLLIPQSETESILRRKVEQQGVDIFWNVEMKGFSSDERDGEITVDLNVGGKHKNLRAKYLISAEGSHSVTRQILGLSFKGKTMGQNYALGDLYIDGAIPEDQLSVFIGKKGFLAAFPMGSRRFRLMVTDPEHHTKNDSAPTLDNLQNLYNQVVHIPGELKNIQWASRYGINSRMMDCLRSGNIFFGGDSAHIHSPAGGQGMNTGIQDMINLSWKLAYVIKGYSNASVLDTYQEERLPVIASLLNTTERATDLFNSLNPFVYSMISIFLPSVLRFPVVQRQGTATISELSNQYPSSALSTGNSSCGALDGGMRLPNTNLLVNALTSGEEHEPQLVFLYRLLDPSRFTLFLVGGNAENWKELFPVHPLVDTYILKTANDNEKEFQDLFGMEPGYVLVRPDAYVAVAGRSDRIKHLEKWLGRWLE